MTNVFDILTERGYIEQSTDNSIRDLLGNESVTFYIGFDPTADSLHVGHFIQIMVMSHMQRAGHRPIALFGGGTGMIGDPSGRTDMRKMMTQETILNNIAAFRKQMSRFIDFDSDIPNRALMVNNGDWLLNLNYVEFIREVGTHFSVNRMLTAECFKNRLERGLSFFEFNYMLMQSYDFLQLYRKYNCKMQLGGNDQWSNIIGGVELCRRMDSAQVYGLTFKLLTNSQGKKMGKTESGALWLDATKTSPYDFYQYWRNIDDADVENCLALLTFLPMEEVRRLGALKDAAINEAKARLAYEVTKLVHGEEEAEKAQAAAQALFAPNAGPNTADLPGTNLPAADLAAGLDILALLTRCGLIKSNGEATRLELLQANTQVN
ncbi:MAG: tyrosine--tRNA ligase, partial [Firmicutes bacterium]|nr:tyrosine--tRNA ligase [Bacillota bacterium]